MCGCEASPHAGEGQWKRNGENGNFDSQKVIHKKQQKAVPRMQVKG